MRHPHLIKWEQQLATLLNALDDVLEDRYGHSFRLHPARAPRDTTSNKAQDGLFRVQANFSLGVGSQHGRGYVIDIHLATLQNAPDELIDEIEEFALNHLRSAIQDIFPDLDLEVAMDGHVIKIFGDLQLGSAYTN